MIIEQTIRGKNIYDDVERIIINCRVDNKKILKKRRRIKEVLSVEGIIAMI